MIGRVKEKEIINKLCQNDQTKLAVIHGRRRIGKTYLVNYMFNTYRDDCIFFEFTGSDIVDSDIQIINFIESIYDWFGEEPTKEIKTWIEAFIFLKRVLTKQIKNSPKSKVVVFIDEVAWVDKHNKTNFISSFGHFYNTFCQKQNNFVVILCGSNASWIQDKILKDTKGPLYHRVDVEIAMLPFTLKETKEYLLKKKKFDIDDKTVIDIYMILGGVAKYLDYLDPTLSINDNINNILFKLNAPLYNEYNTLFKSLFYNKSSKHKEVIDNLASKKSGLTILELAKYSDSKAIDPTHKKLRDTIDELIDTGFVKPLNKLHNKARDTKYIISDPFCLFYNKWLKDITKNDLAGFQNHFNHIINTQQYSIWSGFAFEIVIINNIDLFLKYRGLSGIYKNIGYWHYTPKNENENGAQIDIVVEYQNNIYDIIECKYYNQEVILTKVNADNIINKIDMFKKYGVKVKKYDIKTHFITTYSVKLNTHFNRLNIASNLTVSELLE